MHFLDLGTLPVGDTVGVSVFGTGQRQMAISADGSLLAVVTDHGFAVLPASIVAPTPTSTSTATLTPTATATPSPTSTPAPATGSSEGRAHALRGLAGSVAFASQFQPGGSVNFQKPLRSADYVVQLTPVGRICTPVVTSKSATGFSFVCPGSGGSVDWTVFFAGAEPDAVR